jgi:hypothetical protein
MAPDAIAVVPLGSEAHATDIVAASPSVVSGPYLLYPAATYAHKGHEDLFRTFAVLRRRGDLDARLVLTGERTKRWDRVLLPLLRSLGIDGDVVHLGFVSRDELHRLYCGARAVVFPSHFEGFGIPVLEAARFRKRIVTSRLQVFDEIGVPRHAQVDFTEPEQVLAALRASAPTRLEKAPVTWRPCAERTLEVLREAAAR